MTTASVTSHGGSGDLVPVRDVTPPSAVDVDEAAVAPDGRFSQRAQHHGSMTFVVDFGDGSSGAGGRDRPCSSARNPGTPLSQCLPARLRRKSVQHRMEREEKDEDNDAEVPSVS